METQKKSTLSIRFQNKISIPEIIKDPINGATLYVVMSTEIENTMKAIFTHEHSNLCLIYTPNDLRMKRIIKKLKMGKLFYQTREVYNYYRRILQDLIY